MKKFILSLLMISGMGFTQTNYSPLVLYWKTLEPKEKEVFLMAYLTQVHEMHNVMIAETGYGEMTKWYFDNRAEIAYKILDELEQTDMAKFVGWIDEYYEEKVFSDRPFHDALEYAYVFSQQKGKTMMEKIESLLGEEESVGIKKIEDE
ncbi:MAG: hypothetical protein ACE5EE_05205 [Fidelibacterota bacterium]